MKMSGWLSAFGVAVFATMVAGCAGEVEGVDDPDAVEDADAVASESELRNCKIRNCDKGSSYISSGGRGRMGRKPN